MEPGATGFCCEGLPNEGILVSDIREDLVPESLISKYFGAKATKSGWKYNMLTTHAEQLAILSLYRRVYNTSDIQNKETSLQFAIGLIWMSLGNVVNWSQFREERSRVREGLKKKAEERKVKREREIERLDFGAPSNLAKKRCNARLEADDAPDSFPANLSLTVKSESELLAQYSATMSAGKIGAKVVGKGSGKGFSVNSPKWLEEDLKRIEVVVQETGVLLEESRVSLLERIATVTKIESKLRRSRLLLADRTVMLQESKQQMETLCITEGVFCSAIKTKQISEECDKEQIDLEDLLSKKKMEERTFHRCKDAVQDLASSIQDLEDQLSQSEARKSAIYVRVSSLEVLMQAISEQLLSMREGSGAVFFPQPVAGHPISPVALTHSLNACPICSLWYTSFDYVSIACGHTYHPFCLWLHSKSSSKCALPFCEEDFGSQTVTSLGLRLNAAQSVRVDVKMPTIAPTKDVQSISMLAPSGSANNISNSQGLQKKALLLSQGTKDSNGESIPSQSSHMEVNKKKGSKKDGAVNSPSLLCVVCGEQLATIVLEKCRHESLCFRCIEGKTQCPICKEHIDGWKLSTMASSLNPHLQTLGCATDVSSDPLIANALGKKGAAKGALVLDVAKEAQNGPLYSDVEDEGEEFIHWCGDQEFREGGPRTVMVCDGDDNVQGEGHPKVDVMQEDVHSKEDNCNHELPQIVEAYPSLPHTSGFTKRFVSTKKNVSSGGPKPAFAETLNHTRIVEKTLAALLSAPTTVDKSKAGSKTDVVSAKKGRLVRGSKVDTVGKEKAVGGVGVKRQATSRLGSRTRNLPARLVD